MLRQKGEINKHAKKEKEKKHIATRGNENACEGKEYTSNSGSVSNMGQWQKCPPYV